MDPMREHRQHLSRREFFGRSACGVGTAALAWLMSRDGLAAGAPNVTGVENRVGGLAGLPHFPPKAKQVIYLFQNGAPTHVELFDYKPELTRLHGTPAPEQAIAGK